ncbi:ADP-ribosylation-like factor [Trichosporon asahii var. asahii CBS 2479]|uniref:ADP-ribosylation-like factor n=1 Tax=Trichosporon asahii var. asahii (strain ATCC 90039 / CBS 2479 / JCM 2466 / KCTC 7840 / NBRC 103889/ NCYC 2677 / UAMH 7654) TaxID=1186058 RepID=J5SYU1_TRIAS|nr:ADP-ribosylation-like factor [Trichosporon asahii var. asahii CBS 2479]EJT48261.1 ADP-ribosylation-like factor [Trichosporon asahii var. asahii CBS 2479]
MGKLHTSSKADTRAAHDHPEEQGEGARDACSVSTTILKRLTGGDVREVSPTLGFNITTLVRTIGSTAGATNAAAASAGSSSAPTPVEGAGDTYTLNVWDVGGQRTLRPYWRNYFESTDAVVWVADSSDTLRLDDCSSELRQLLSEQRLAGCTLLVLANKQDLAGSLSMEQVRDQLHLDGIESHTWRILPCSAITGEGLDGAMDWVTAEVASRLYYGGRSAANPGVIKEEARETRAKDEIATQVETPDQAVDTRAVATAA